MNITAARLKEIDTLEPSNMPVITVSGRIGGYYAEAAKLPAPADIWVDTIPFTETRRYVRAVLAYTTIFEWQMQKRVMPLSERMVEIFVAR